MSSSIMLMDCSKALYGSYLPTPERVKLRSAVLVQHLATLVVPHDCLPHVPAKPSHCLFLRQGLGFPTPGQVLPQLQRLLTL